MTESPFDYEPSSRQYGLWRKNHGNFLLGVVALILMIGGGIISYQQNRFRRPKFPDGSSLTTPSDSTIEPTVDAEGKMLVKIIAIGAVNDAGVMRVAVYDTATEFNQPMKAVMKAPKQISEGIAEWELPIDQLPEAFALAAYHDENNDSVLNKNVAGIPTERYGFSNKARGTFGPPSFDQAVINRPSEPTIIEVFIR